MTLTPQGFKRKRYDELITELQQQARELFGANINLNDDSPLGQWIKLLAYQRAEENELAEDVYNSDFVDTAEGNSLDNVVKRRGIYRDQAQRAVSICAFEVDPGVTIPSGILVSTADRQTRYITTGSMTATTEGVGHVYVNVGIEAILTGPSGNTPTNTIINIDSPLSGVYGVTNIVEATGGRNVETDAELREKYYRSLAKGGGASVPSIEAELLNLTGVSDARVSENDSGEIKDGLPPHCIAPFVYGGDDNEVAQTIYSYKAGGIRSFGTTVIDVVDSMNKTHQIGFSRPNIIPVYVRITLTKNGNYPQTGDKEVVTNILKYIGGTDADGVDYDGQGLGNNIIQYKVIAAVATISGIDDVTVELSTDDVTYSSGNILIDSNDIAKSHYTRVVIQ